MPDVNTAAGAKVYIGPAITDSTDTQGEFEALVYTPLEKVESVSPFGDQANEVNFTPLDTRRVLKKKGSYNAGNLDMVLAHVAGATGQEAFIAATASDSDYAFKVEINDAGSGSPSSPTTYYIRGQAMSWQVDVGNAENIVRVNASVGINNIIRVAAV